MPSSEPLRGPVDGSPGRVLRGAVAVLLGAFGLLLVAYPLTPQGRDGGGWFVAALGLLVLATAAVLWLNGVARPAGGRRTRMEQRPDGPALVVRLRPTAPLTMLLIGSTGALLFAVAVLGVGVTEGGLLFLPLVVLFAVLVPDAVAALRRRPRLELGRDGATLVGYAVESSLAWDDVVSVGPGADGLVLTGRPGAPSWRCTRRPRLVPMERVPDGPYLAVPAGALDEPTRVEVVARRLVAATPAERASYLQADVLAFLGGDPAAS